MKGINIPGTGLIKITAFADDTNFFLKNPTQIRHVLIFFELFKLACVVCLNIDKCFVMFLEPWKLDKDFYFGIKVARTPQKIFGIYFDNKGINIKTLIDLKLKIIQLTQELKNRSRTLRGRASIFNVPIASKLWYVASVHVISPVFSKKITRIMFQFIWNSNLNVFLEILCI